MTIKNRGISRRWYYWTGKHLTTPNRKVGIVDGIYPTVVGKEEVRNGVTSYKVIAGIAKVGVSPERDIEAVDWIRALVL